MPNAQAPEPIAHIRVLLIDDHLSMRAGLRMLVESWQGFCVVGEAGNRLEALRVAQQEQPDIILLDLDLRVENGLDLIPVLRAAVRGARIILLTGILDRAAHHNAIRLGAVGLVMKDEAAETLMKAIEKVHAGEIWLDRTTAATVLSEMSRPDAEKPIDPEAVKILLLTPREREVITLVGEGLKNQHIADRLFISESTVRHHLTSIFDKLGVSDRFALIIYAYRQGLVRLPSE